ncbi:aminotransferase class V-fold PLP-dependent enzyme [candidate division KSB1 bacterium]
MDNLIDFRNEFPALKDNVYLINHSIGATPEKAVSYLKEYTDIWNGKNVKAWEEDWWGLNTEVGNIVAEIINAPKDVISFHPNVTAAMATVLSCFDFSKNKNKIVYTDMAFPSVKYLLQSFLPKSVEHNIIESEDGISVPTEKIIDAIDDNTLLVPISHVFFRSSYLQDVKTIIDKAHTCGAYVLLDSYQAVGTVPIDAADLNVDVLAGGTIKWLCGGPGAAFLYVKPDLALELKPKITGWCAHENPFAFADKMKYSENISYRFLNGTPLIPGIYSAKAGIEIIRDIGVNKIRERSLSLTQRIIDQTKNYGFTLNTPEASEKRGGTVVVQLENSQKISEELVKRKFLVDWRPQAGIRISPHFYNTEDEVDSIMEEIKSLSKK